MRFYWGHWGHPHYLLQILGLWWLTPNSDGDCSGDIRDRLTKKI